MTFLVEVIVEICVDAGELLQRLHLPESEHGPLSSSERQMAGHCQTNQQLVRFPAGGFRHSCQRMLSAKTNEDQIKYEAWRWSHVETR